MKTILPKVSVVMSVFNSELYLKSAIESILNQSYSNLEFIIINDCSTDNSETIIKSFNDNRIKYIKEFENIGLETALNKNFMLAEGEFIARMDADDIASPDRLKHQVEFLMANGEIDLVGTWYEKITNTVSLGIKPQQSDYKKLKFRLFFGNNIAHPTIMFRRKLIDNGDYYYKKEYTIVADYELWTRLAIKYNLDNIKLNLLKYRVHPNQITNTKLSLQRKNFKKAHQSYISNFLEINDIEEIKRISVFFLHPSKLNFPDRMFTAINIWNHLKTKDLNKSYCLIRLLYWTFLKRRG